MTTTRKLLERIATAVETIPRPIVQEQHFHREPGLELVARLEEHPNAGELERNAEARTVAEREFRLVPVVDHPAARIAVLAVALALKAALDDSEPITGAEIQKLGDDYLAVQELRDVLGIVTGADLAAAEALGVRVTI